VGWVSGCAPSWRLCSCPGDEVSPRAPRPARTEMSDRSTGGPLSVVQDRLGERLQLRVARALELPHQAMVAEERGAVRCLSVALRDAGNRVVPNSAQGVSTPCMRASCRPSAAWSGALALHVGAHFRGVRGPPRGLSVRRAPATGARPCSGPTTPGQGVPACCRLPRCHIVMGVCLAPAPAPPPSKPPRVIPRRCAASARR